MQWRKVGKKTLNMFLSFIVCSNRNRSALVHDLLSYNSLFVSQLYEDQITSVQQITARADLFLLHYKSRRKF